jgi:hypothetical protein
METHPYQKNRLFCWNGPASGHEELDLIFTWREPRKVSHVLTLQYAKTMYLLADAPMTRKLIGKYIEVYEYPDGRIELRADGIALPYATYDRYPELDQGAIVENKRLGHVLQWRNSRSSSATVGAAGRHRRTVDWHRRSITPPSGTKAQRMLDASDIEHAIKQTMH